MAAFEPRKEVPVMIVLEADSLADVWALVARDPYVTEGVFNRVEVKPFQQVLP